MQLSGDEVLVLTRLAHRPVAKVDTPTDVGRVLDELNRRGLARTTVTNWVITDDGRRALTGVDGRARVAVQRWGRNSRRPPS